MRLADFAIYSAGAIFPVLAFGVIEGVGLLLKRHGFHPGASESQLEALHRSRSFVNHPLIDAGEDQSSIKRKGDFFDIVTGVGNDIKAPSNPIDDALTAEIEQAAEEHRRNRQAGIWRDW